MTKAAMKAIGYDIDLPETNANALHVGPQELSVFNSATTSYELTREFTNESYMINILKSKSAPSMQLMVDQNRNRGHGGCADCYDPSIKKALRYFGFIPFGPATASNVYPGSSSTVRIVQNGRLMTSGISGREIKSGKRTFGLRFDFHIFVSANSAEVHDHLYAVDEGPFLPQTTLLARYFGAKRVKTVIDVGHDKLDMESESSFNSVVRCRRYILVFN